MDMQNRDRTTPDVQKSTKKDKSVTGLDVQSVLNIQQNPMVLIDDHYRIIAANQAYQEAYGVQSDEVIGRCCHEISHHSPVPCHMRGEDCPHQAVFTTGEAHDVRHIHYDHQNHAEHVRIRGHAIKDQDGNTYLGEEIIRLPHQEEDITCGDMRMVGRSPAFMKCLHHIEMAGRTDASILLYGESGVGKELAASALHQFSARASEAFITVDCTSLPETLFESEILGCVTNAGVSLRCCIEDGSRPPEVCLQGLASNRPVPLRSKGVVVSDRGKGADNGVR